MTAWSDLSARERMEEPRVTTAEMIEGLIAGLLVFVLPIVGVFGLVAMGWRS